MTLANFEKVGSNNRTKVLSSEEDQLKQIRILLRSANVYGGQKNKTGFDTHNLRKDDLAPHQRNYTEELSHNNQFFRNGKPLSTKSVDQLIGAIEKSEKKKIASVRGGEMTDHQITTLNIKRTKTKAKVKKWCDSSTSEEKTFFESLYEKIGNTEIDAEKEIANLSDCGKVKRFNDKQKAIRDLENCNDLLKVKNNCSMNMKIISSEKIFKIPDQHKINVKSEDWNKITTDFHQKYYSDFDHYYTAIHLDEKEDNPHAHHRFSGFNNKTKSFDLPDHELNLVRKLYNKPDLFDGKKWSALEPDQVKKFGELYQTFMFKFVNQELKNLGYEVEAVKRTPQEVENDNHEYSNENIRSRKFNGVNKLKDEEQNLLHKNKALQKANNSLTEKIKDKLISWFDDIHEYFKNKNRDENKLERATNTHLEIENQTEELASIFKDELDTLSNSDQNEYNQVLNNKRNKLRR